MSKSKDLKYFIRRSTALSLYRSLLKECRSLTTEDQVLGNDVKNQVKREFRFYYHENDVGLVSVLLKNGGQQLEMLRGMGKNANKLDSWIGKTDDDGSDERGRVGDVWPWQST